MNLIAYNPTAAGFQGSASYVVEQFAQALERGGVRLVLPRLPRP